MLKTLPSEDDVDIDPLPLPDLSNDALYFRYHLVEFVTEHLIDLSRAFDGDLQAVLVLAVIGQVHAQERLKHGVDPGNITRSIAATDCTSIIEMTPLCKVEVTLPRVRGFREVRRAGGVDEQAGVRPAGGAAWRAVGPVADCGCVPSA